MSSYDCVIIGAGHNGLVAAAYLARAGRKVCLLERRHVLGGCTSTEELWPGFKSSPVAYVISLFLPQIIRELRLAEHGLKILPRNPSSFTPLIDGRYLLLGHDEALNRRQIAKFSARDAEAYPDYEAMLTRVAEVIEPLMAAPPPALPPRIRDLGKWWRVRGAIKRLGGDLRSAVELLAAPATRILDRYFESEPLRATLATDAVIGAFAAPSSPGSAYVLLHHVMGETGGKRGVWGYVRGGMGGLADALEKSCRAAGVEIRRESEVAAVRLDEGRAAGVVLADGTEIPARAVASCIDAHQTFLKLVGREHLPEDFRRQVERIDYASASAKINLALDGLPDFNTPDVDPQEVLRGTTHVVPDVETIERAFDDAKYGRPSREPVLEITIPSVVDDSLAPPGKHVASIFVQYAPYELAEGAWDDRRDAFAERCLDVFARYAPGIRDRILHRQVLTPLDLERTYGLTGGNIMQGAMGLDQLGPMRLDYRTPIRGLYLCGAATHPGGGVIGACGRNAARAILRGR
ncbi:MAG: phytoene desaturase family protein [Planctomycetota bacterium]|jgi:phytoene dehydrogenase-like protein